MHSTITHNLVILLKSGAFGTPADTSSAVHATPADSSGEGGADILEMSPYKWRVLSDAASHLGVLGYVVQGACNLSSACKYIPESLTSAHVLQDEYNATDAAVMCNRFTQRHLDDVREEEMNSPNTSEETLQLLDILVANTNGMVCSDLSVEGIIALGVFIRKNAKVIDYDKLTRWLYAVGIVQMASLQGNMLIACMGFTREELPFVTRSYARASRLFVDRISKALEKHSFPIFTRLNVAMVETVSHRLGKAVSLITNIEE